jgi:Mn2+/Fe2+ NRAMP family transporter
MTYSEHAMKRLLRYFGMTHAARVTPSAFAIAVICAVGAGAASKSIGLNALIGSAVVVVVVVVVMLWILTGRHSTSHRP